MTIKAFNETYFLVLFIGLIIIVLFTVFLKKKSYETKRKVLLGYCLFNIILYFIYKGALMMPRAEYSKYGYEFNIWLELPLQLCNISMFLVPIGILLNKGKISQFLKGYGFFVAPLGAFMAITSPEPLFNGTSLLEFYNIGFYFTHLNILCYGILLVTLGFYRPSYKAMPLMVGFIFILSIVIYGADKLLSLIGGVTVNYFFLVNPGGVSILESFWKIIPCEYFYMIFGIVILVAYMALVTLPFYLSDKKQNHKLQKASL